MALFTNALVSSKMFVRFIMDSWKWMERSLILVPLKSVVYPMNFKTNMIFIKCYSNWVMYRVSNSRGLEYNLLTYIRIRIHRNQATTYFMPEFLTKRFFFAKTAFFETPRCHMTISWRTTVREISCGPIKINKWKARCWGTNNINHILTL